MKTTLEIPDQLFAKVKSQALKRKASIKEIIQEALRAHLDGSSQKKKSFKLERRSFKGNGLREGVTETDWSSIQEKIYEGRGG